MNQIRIPDDAILLKETPRYNGETIPAPLLDRHQLKPGCWGALHIHAGRVRFVDLSADTERLLESPTTHTIPPEMPHKLVLDGPIELHIEFFVDGLHGEQTHEEGEMKPYDLDQT